MPSLKRLYAAVENRALDVLFARQLLSQKTLAKHALAHDTVPTDWHFLKKIFEGQSFGETDKILDVGCGTGRAMIFLARRFPKARISGVELNAAVADVARSAVPARCEVIAGDVLAADLTGVTVFYLFNPFGQELMARFCEQVLNPRKAYTLIYAVPAHLEELLRRATGDVRAERRRVVSPLRALDREYAVVTKAGSTAVSRA